LRKPDESGDKKVAEDILKSDHENDRRGRRDAKGGRGTMHIH
jgi:hypothetical protein